MPITGSDAPLTRESVKSVYDLFWNLALRIEDGDLTLAEQDLRDIQNKLMDALSNGASDDQIKSLMSDLKAALQRYMQALSQQTEKAIARGEVAPQMPGQNVVTSKDFQDMMQAIEDMARTGRAAKRAKCSRSFRAFSTICASAGRMAA